MTLFESTRMEEDNEGYCLDSVPKEDLVDLNESSVLETHDNNNSYKVFPKTNGNKMKEHFVELFQDQIKMKNEIIEDQKTLVKKFKSLISVLMNQLLGMKETRNNSTETKKSLSDVEDNKEQNGESKSNEEREIVTVKVKEDIQDKEHGNLFTYFPTKILKFTKNGYFARQRNI